MDIDILDLAKLDKNARRKKIFEIKQYDIFKLFAEERQCSIDFVPILDSDSILEINSECGIITERFAEKAKKVIAVEPNPLFHNCSKYVNCENENIEFVNESIDNYISSCKEKFDYIFVINNSYELFKGNRLKTINNLLVENGKLIIATNNKLGLKYWAGCQEELNGGFFVGIENYQLINTDKRLSSKLDIEKTLSLNGIQNYRFMYPYPDYIFPTSIYTDARLPKSGELDNNIRNFEGERYLLFDEKKVFDMIIEEKLFPLYSNSYLIVIDR